MEELKWMQQIIWTDYPMLETNILSSSDSLHVWKNKTDQKGLKFLVNFHLIFKVQNDCTIIANLITFNGKTVDSLVFHKQEQQSAAPEHIKVFLNDFATDHSLCLGIDRFNVDHNEDHLMEFLNDTIIVRSIKCRFKLKPNSAELFCEECAKIKLVKSEPLVAITKIEEAENDVKDVLALSIGEPNNETEYENDHYNDDDNDHGDFTGN